MAEIIKYIEKINSLNYSGQCKYTKSKLLSFKTIDVPHTVFLKKLYVLLDNLPWYIKESNIKQACVKSLLLIFGGDLKRVSILMMIEAIFKQNA